MAGTGNLILKRGTTIPFGGEDDGTNPVLLKGMPAVQLVGWSKTTDGNATSGTAGPYAFDNYENRLWIGQQGFGSGTSNPSGAGIPEDFSVVGVQPYTSTAAQTVEFTRPMWMGAEIRAFTPIKKDNTNDSYYTILKADWDRPSDYVLVTQQAIAFAPQRIWATGTPQDTNGTPPPPALRRYIEWATVDHGNGSNDPWKTGTTHLSKKLVIPVATPAVGQTLVVAQNGVTTDTVNGVDVVTLEWAQSGGGSTLTLIGDSATTASVANTTETITFAGGDGITTVVTENTTTANTVTISQNINELTAKTPVLADAVAINDSENSNAIKKSTFTNIRDLIRSNLNISSLNAATVTSDDLLIVEESSTVKKTTVGALVDFIGDAANSDVTVSNTGQTTIGAGKVTNTMLATASAAATNSTVAIRDASGNLVATQFTGPSTLVKGTAINTGSANKILFASSINGNDVTVSYDSNASPLRYDAVNSKLIVQNLEVLGTEQVNTKISASVGAPYLTLNSDYSIYNGISVGGITTDGISNSEPVENARVIVNRGPLADTELRWNETTEKWELVTTKSYTNALTSIVKSQTTGLTINYAPTVSGYTRKFQTGEYVSISGLSNNREYNNLWKVATSSYTNPTNASFTVTEKTLRHSQIVITQNQPNNGRTQFTVTHDYTYPIPLGTQTVTITGNTTSALNNTYTGANVSGSTNTQLVFDVQTSSYSGLNGTSGTNVASADTNYVTTTANGASAATLSTPTDNLNCKLTGVWAYPLMYADGADTLENNTGEEQIIDKLTVRTLNMAGTWNLGSSITTDLNLASGGLVLPQAQTPPPVGTASTEGRIYWDTNDDLLIVGTGSGAKTFVDTDSSQTLTNKTLTAPRVSSGSHIADSAGAVLISFPSTVASSVNAINISNAATGSAPTISATGTDANVGLTIAGRGTGNIIVGSGTNTVTIGGSGATVSGTLGVSGATTLTGALTANGDTSLNGNITLGNQTYTSGTFTSPDVISISSGTVFASGTQLRANPASTNTLSIAAWDTDSTQQYRNLITVTSGATPSVTIGGTGMTGSITGISISGSTGSFTSVAVDNSAITSSNLTTTTGSLVGPKLNIAASTITTGTSAAGTYNDVVYTSIGSATFQNTTNAITIVEASNLYVAAPVASTNVTIGTAYAIKAAGNVKVDGNLVFEGSTTNDFETTLAVTDPTADRTITLPDWTGTAVVPSGTASSGFLIVGNGTGQPAWTDNDLVTVGGVYFRNETTGTNTTRFPIPFLAASLSTDNPSTFGALSDNFKTQGYLKTDWNTTAPTGSPATNASTGLMYETGNGVGTLYVDYIGATLDCGTYS